MDKQAPEQGNVAVMEDESIPGEELPTDAPADPENPEEQGEPATVGALDKAGTETATIQSKAAKVKQLQAQIAKIRASDEKHPTKAGSRPRANVTYTLLKAPPNWHRTPQVAQLMKILFDPSVIEKYKTVDPSTGESAVRIPEPDLFDLVRAGAEAGKLGTKQSPVRIFQYYRNDLLNVNAIRWE